MNRPSRQTPTPTDPRQRVDAELGRWSRIYSSPEYVYGEEAGPVARRAARYHRPFLPRGGAALDAGCGEGQDLAFLAERGYDVTGIEFTVEGAEKARRLLAERGFAGRVMQDDLRRFVPEEQYDLVLAVNSLQFLGADAPSAMDRVMAAVAPGGVIGLSLFGREPQQPDVSGAIWFVTLSDLLRRFEGWQCMEAAKLWQWNLATNEPRPFVTLIARKAPPAAGSVIHLD